MNSLKKPVINEERINEQAFIEHVNSLHSPRVGEIEFWITWYDGKTFMADVHVYYDEEDNHWKATAYQLKHDGKLFETDTSKILAKTINIKQTW